MTGSSLRHTVRAWKSFADWLLTRKITSMTAVDAGTLADYAIFLRDAERTRNYALRQLFALTRHWAYSPYLLPQDRIPMPPWDEHGTDDYLVAPRTSKGRNHRVPIHPATMSPLLVWALRFVTDFASDILAGHDEHTRLFANIRPERKPGEEQTLQAYFEHLRATGQPIPGVGKNNRGPAFARPAINVRYIAGTLGISIQTARVVINRDRAQLRERPLNDGANLDVPITGRINAKPWLEGIDLDQAPVLVMNLKTACLIVVSYLSGMRPEEVLHLRHGCCTAAGSDNDGVVRHLVTGLHFKGVTDDEGNTITDGEIREQPWIVIAPVATAIAVLERLTNPGDLLFPLDTGGPSEKAAWRGQSLPPVAATARIERFVTLANELAHQHERDHELIPADPAGAIVLSRLRQTVGWFINRLPGGRVALGVQYGHLQLTMSEAYGSRAGMDMTEILDLERARTLADTLTHAAERLRDGEHVSGPAAERYQAGAAEFTATFQGSHLTARQHRALLNNPRLRVFDHDDALLACNHNPLKALCDPHRGNPSRRTGTPTFDRCNTACGNIARTDTHIERARREAAALQDEINTGLHPHPIQQRHEQRRQKLLKIIDQHEHSKPTPSPEPPQ
ncbi:hypothetical protein AVR91_0208960 [Amycolatopsis keratiniphila subsp. keratiniphila]|uniref:Integrase n=1 Tax=Amycolatopsis keratiniphila subsp. keratiniphila TaxID=227715 RepID=A0A1W2LZP9_9PSEU|nr:hypothetical protein AVR91_0208960 [Amycolatopsis keratiniphila subsp. keratiniphila]